MKRDAAVTDEFYHQQAVEAEEARERALEDVRDEIRKDKDDRARLAVLYVEKYEDDFLTWASERVLSERTPEHTEAWEENAS